MSSCNCHRERTPGRAWAVIGAAILAATAVLTPSSAQGPTSTTPTVAYRFRVSNSALASRGQVRVPLTGTGMYWYDTAEHGFRETGDSSRSLEPVSGASGTWGLPRLTEMPADTTPGTLAYILPTDGTHACEGQVAVRVTAGICCWPSGVCQ